MRIPPTTDFEGLFWMRSFVDFYGRMHVPLNVFTTAPSPALYKVFVMRWWCCRGEKMPKRDATVCISQTVMLAKQEGRTQTIQVHDTTTLDVLKQ
jgi:hypothetical protein